jgi:hypothetical protein
LTERTQLAQRKLLSTLRDIAEANEIYFTEELTDQFTAIKRYGEFVSTHDNTTPSFGSINLSEAFRLSDSQHYDYEETNGPGLLLYCHTCLAIQKVYNSLDPINIRRNINQPIIDFSVVTTRCVFNIVTAVWDKIITIYGEEAPCPLLNKISSAPDDPEREPCEKIGSKDAYTTMKAKATATAPTDPRPSKKRKKLTRDNIIISSE